MKKRPKRESKELPEKDKCHYQIYISIKVNIHKVSKEVKLFSLCRYAQTISIVCCGAPNNNTPSYTTCISRGDKTLLINMHQRLGVCNPTACQHY